MSETNEERARRIRIQLQIARSQEAAPEPEVEPEQRAVEAGGLSALGSNLAENFVDEIYKWGQKAPGLLSAASIASQAQARPSGPIMELQSGVPMEEQIEAQQAMLPKMRAQLKANQEARTANNPIMGNIGSGLGTVAPYLSSLPMTATTYGSAGIIGKTAMGLLEGGITGAAASEVGEADEGAFLGAALGGGIPGLGHLAGKLTNAVANGVVKLRPEARKLMEDTYDTFFIPLSQAAESGLVRNWYRGVVSNTPGAASYLREQYDDALVKLREMAAELAAPPGLAGQSSFRGKSSPEIFDQLHSAWKTAYNKFHEMPINTSPKIGFPRSEVVDEWVAKNVKGIDLDSLKTGKELTLVYKEINDAVSKMKPDEYAYIGKELLDWIDSSNASIGQQLKPGTKFGDIRDEWELLGTSWKNWRQLKDAEWRSSARGKEYSVNELASATRTVGESSKESGLKALADVAREGLEDFTSNPEIFQMVAATGVQTPVTTAIGGAIGGLPGAAIGAAAPFGISRMLASPKVQRALAGSTSFQQSIREILESAAPQAEKARAVRQFLITAGIVNLSDGE